MDLLEYQAKKLFRQVGIPILPSQTIKDPRQIKQLQIPYPVVLKSQVRAGGRGKAGGVKFVENTIDAIAAARNIFSLSILGEYPDVILAEARYDAHRELFLAIALDYQLKHPVLFGSSMGGMDVKLLLKNLQQVVIETEFSPFYARRLASKMNLSGNLLLSVSKIIEKMYDLFQAKDLEFVEINPLGVNREGELMALDGKMTISQNALSRHPEIFTLSNAENLEKKSKINGSRVKCLDWQNPQGKIAIIANDLELTVLGWDLISQAKKKPAFGMFLDYDLWHDGESTQLFCVELTDIFNQLQSFDNIKLVLLNFWATEKVNKAIAKAIFDYNQDFLSEKDTEPEKKTKDRVSSKSAASKTNAQSPTLKFIVRLLDEDIKSYQDEFKASNIYWTNNLEEAILRIKNEE